VCPEHARAREYLEGMANNPDFVVSDLALAELYVLLRNPKVVSKTLSARDAAAYCSTLRSNPAWQIAEYSLGSMALVWEFASKLTNPYQIFDLRLGFALKRHGVREFATRNTKDFRLVSFEKLINPIDV